MRKILILPTGDEVFSGIILDTNSPKIMAKILEDYPAAQITRATPLKDRQAEILNALQIGVEAGNDLIITIGGSGGGGKYSHSLAPDYTHEAILQLAPDAARISIFGYNGHLWSKIVVGKVEQTLIITLPGPQVEALAGLSAGIEKIQAGNDVQRICQAMASAVLAQYPRGGHCQCS